MGWNLPAFMSLCHNEMGGGAGYVFICRRAFICNLYLGIADLHRQRAPFYRA